MGRPAVAPVTVSMGATRSPVTTSMRVTVVGLPVASWIDAVDGIGAERETVRDGHVDVNDARS